MPSSPSSSDGARDGTVARVSSLPALTSNHMASTTSWEALASTHTGHSRSSVRLKLPAALSSTDTEASRAVLRQLQGMDESVQRRHPTQLESAIKEAGQKYLKTLHFVRRSRSTSVLQRHALETAMATEAVKARTTLMDWKQGMKKIGKAQQQHDPLALKGALAAWHFAEDEPVVVSALKDLDHWQSLQETLPAKLGEAVESRDIKKLRVAVKEASACEALVKESLEKARDLLKRYEVQLRDLRVAQESGSAARMQRAFKNWEFDKEEPLLVAVRSQLDAFEERVAELAAALVPAAGGKPDLRRLSRVVDSWTFENTVEEYVKAKAILDQWDSDCAKLEALILRPMPNMYNIKSQVAAMGGTQISGSGHTWHRALQMLREHEDAVKVAIDKSDGEELRRLWDVGGGDACNGGLEGLLLEQAQTALEEYAKALQEHAEKAAALLQAQEDALVDGQEILGKIETIDLLEMRARVNPPALICKVFEAILILLDMKPSWKAAVIETSKQDFLYRLLQLDAAQMKDSTLAKLQPYLEDESITFEKVKAISRASGYLWKFLLVLTSQAKAMKATAAAKVQESAVTAPAASQEEDDFEETSPASPATASPEPLPAAEGEEDQDEFEAEAPEAATACTGAAKEEEEQDDFEDEEESPPPTAGPVGTKAPADEYDDQDDFEDEDASPPASPNTAAVSSKPAPTAEEQDGDDDSFEDEEDDGDSDYEDGGKAVEGGEDGYDGFEREAFYEDDAAQITAAAVAAAGSPDDDGFESDGES